MYYSYSTLYYFSKNAEKRNLPLLRNMEKLCITYFFPLAEQRAALFLTFLLLHLEILNRRDEKANSTSIYLGRSVKSSSSEVRLISHQRDLSLLDILYF